jgi:hypothetical protein
VSPNTAGGTSPPTPIEPASEHSAISLLSPQLCLCCRNARRKPISCILWGSIVDAHRDSFEQAVCTLDWSRTLNSVINSPSRPSFPSSGSFDHSPSFAPLFPQFPTTSHEKPDTQLVELRDRHHNVVRQAFALRLSVRGWYVQFEDRVKAHR